MGHRYQCDKKGLIIKVPFEVLQQEGLIVRDTL